VRRSDNRWEREERQRDLAKRMIGHAARTQTIVEWTGLTRYQVQLIVRGYPETSVRHRGASPFQPAFFSRSPLRQRESAALASIALDMQIITRKVDGTARSAAVLDRGERLVDAYELFRSLAPDSIIQLEHAILLVTELAKGRALVLGKCPICSGLIIVDRQGPPELNCGFCRAQVVSPD
jgi:hypothetical protein